MLESHAALRPDVLAARGIHGVQDGLDRAIADDMNQQLIVVLD